MSIAELGSLGEFIGYIAVLVTLIYLALQIRQNTTTYIFEVGAARFDPELPFVAVAMLRYSPLL